MQKLFSQDKDLKSCLYPSVFYDYFPDTLHTLSEKLKLQVFYR